MEHKGLRYNEGKYDSGREYCKLTNSGISSVSSVLSKRKLYFKGKIIIFENDTLTSGDIKRIIKSHQLKRVLLYTTSGEFISEFESVTACAAFIGCKDAEVRMCYTGRRSRIRNYIVKLKDNYGTTNQSIKV